MSVQRVTEYLLEHRWRALALTLVCTFIPILGLFSILLAALVTLRKGAREGAMFILAATLPYLASVYAPGGVQSMPSILVIGSVCILVVSNFLTYIFAVSLHQYKNLSKVLQWAALLGMLAVSLLHLIYPDMGNWWETQLPVYFNQVGTLFSQGQDSVAAQLEARPLKDYASVFIAAVLIKAILQLLIARWWEGVVYSPKTGALHRELHQIRLSRLFGIFLLAGLLLCYLGNPVALDIMPVLCMLFVVAGLSLVHFVVALIKSSGWFWLTLIYLAIWLFPFSIACIAMVALLDVWFNFRGRINGIAR